MIIRPLNRVNAGAAVPPGGSTTEGSVPAMPVLTAPVPAGAVPRQADQCEPVQLELSRQAGTDGYQVIRVVGELDIATAEKAYSYISKVIDGGHAPVTVDLSGLTFCDASGLGVLARISRHARQAGRQLKLASARPSLLKLMRLTGLDVTFPELRPSARAYPA